MKNNPKANEVLAFQIAPFLQKLQLKMSHFRILQAFLANSIIIIVVFLLTFLLNIEYFVILHYLNIFSVILWAS